MTSSFMLDSGYGGSYVRCLLARSWRKRRYLPLHLIGSLYPEGFSLDKESLHEVVSRYPSRLSSASCSRKYPKLVHPSTFSLACDSQRSRHDNPEDNIYYKGFQSSTKCYPIFTRGCCSRTSRQASSRRSLYWIPGRSASLQTAAGSSVELALSSLEPHMHRARSGLQAYVQAGRPMQNVLKTP